MTTVAAHQPQYIPWLPYLAKMEQADVFVWLDDTQYDKRGLQNRNMVRVADAGHWLTVPVRAHQGDLIRDVPIARPGWIAEHAATLKNRYPKARAEVDDLVLSLDPSGTSLVEAAMASTRWLMAALGIETRCVLASSLDVSGTRAERLASICTAVGADTYLSGNGARAYQTPEVFARVGVKLLYQRYAMPEYPQARKGFVPDLSALDLVLCNPRTARDTFRSGLLEPEPA